MPYISYEVEVLFQEVKTRIPTLRLNSDWNTTYLYLGNKLLISTTGNPNTVLSCYLSGLNTGYNIKSSLKN